MSSENKVDSKNLARSMFIIAWILLFALLTISFGKWDSRQKNPNSQIVSSVNSEIKEVILAPDRHHHYIFSGKINHQSVTFLIDTGATQVSIPEKVAERLKLSKGYPVQVSTANGVVTVYNTRINRLEIGPIILSNLRAHINPHMDSEKILLGMSALRKLDFSTHNNQLILRLT